MYLRGRIPWGRKPDSAAAAEEKLPALLKMAVMMRRAVLLVKRIQLTRGARSAFTCDHIGDGGRRPSTPLAAGGSAARAGDWGSPLEHKLQGCGRAPPRPIPRLPGSG